MSAESYNKITRMLPAKAIECDVGYRGVKWFAELVDSGVLNLSPDFQRDSVWGIQNRSRLIESVLENYPIPAVFLYRQKSHKKGRKFQYDVIDGKQRIETILGFLGELDDRFQFDVHLRDINGDSVVFGIDDIGDKRNQILNYRIPVIIITRAGIDEIRQVFIRINSTGKALTADERRNALFADSEQFKAILRLANNSSVRRRLETGKVVSLTSLTRQKHIGLIANLVLSMCTDDGPIDKNKAVDRILDPKRGGLSVVRVRKACKRIKSAIMLVDKLGEDFVRSTRFHSISNYFSLVYFLAKHDRDMVLKDPKRLRLAGFVLRKLNRGLIRADMPGKSRRGSVAETRVVKKYRDATMEGADSRRNRLIRNEILESLLCGLFKEKDSQRLATEDQRQLLWDSSNKKCACCGKELHWGEFQVDHIVPHSRGGKSDLENFDILCPKCNRKKSNRM